MIYSKNRKTFTGLKSVRRVRFLLRFLGSAVCIWMAVASCYAGPDLSENGEPDLLEKIEDWRYADPNMDDLNRVKKQFLVLRFQAITSPEYQNMNDRQLFRKSCLLSRVSYPRVLAMLKEKDTDFYNKLMNSR